MHAMKGGWVGQTFALATSDDSARRKSRIRRSKEERKDMVESYIKKFQKLNNGNFPSLNLTHKEVGGSFYTVREIVREIIQENRVLAPPKVLVDEHDHSGFIEQHPLGSLSIESQTDSYILANAVNGRAVHEENQEFDPVVNDTVPINHQAYSEDSSQSGHIFGRGSQSHGNEQYINNNDERVDREKVEEFRQRTYSESVVISTLDGQKERDKVEASQAVTYHVKSNVVVETFPLRPIVPTIHNMDGESGDMFKTTKTFEDTAIRQEKIPSMESSNSPVIEEDLKRNQDLELELELNHENVEEKVEQHLQIPSLESSNSCTVGTSVPDVKNVESNGSLPDGTKAVDSTKSDTILEQIDTETQEETSEKPIGPENNNTVLAYIKTFITAFVKFWTE
ncbi:hypothetical protein F511_06782 [Dorcoceras hygrometricum]|uniref:AT3G52170-like helix-turn-helix domain-containing protein n=1 Tax=Dorcoceras hygrometricum TaxID=472368 RepID=A0A2Z7D797_9LAMI|nr:hypothetical protein F511_06782 [Dorcoceras hygrometricum]